MTLKTISTACLIRNRARIRALWRVIPAPADGVFPMETLYGMISEELHARGY